MSSRGPRCERHWPLRLVIEDAPPEVPRKPFTPFSDRWTLVLLRRGPHVFQRRVLCAAEHDEVFPDLVKVGQHLGDSGCQFWLIRVLVRVGSQQRVPLEFEEVVVAGDTLGHLDATAP